MVIHSLSESFVTFYESFSTEKIQMLGELYDGNIVFKDPIHEVRGLKALKGYFTYLCDNEGSSAFSISEAVLGEHGVGEKNGDKTGLQSAFFRWQMTYSHPKLASGKILKLDGCSLVKYDKKILFQEDFYDMGQMVYQHIPVVGWAVKKINKHLAGPSFLSKGDVFSGENVRSSS